MKLIEHSHSNFFEGIYDGIRSGFRSLRTGIVPYLRRILRFAALPYCLFFEINWKTCEKPKLKVFLDLLHIFFIYKYYPDNYYLCRFWKIEKSEWKYYYGSIYDPYQRKALESCIYRKENIILFENKLVCYELCRSAGFPLPHQPGMIYPDDNYAGKLVEYLSSSVVGKLVLKPYDGMGGKGIAVAYKDNGIIYIKKKNSVCRLADFELNYPCVIQEYVQQHHLLNRFSDSVNTIRMATLLTKDKSDVLLLGAFIRFGVGNSDVDNLSSGGVAAGVNVDTGGIYDLAVDFNGDIHHHHPSSGIPFKGFTVPFWDEVTNLARKVQRHFEYHKLLGLDIAVTEKGPVIIEINAVQDLVAMEMTYGPILKRPEVLDEFGSYGILINGPTKVLYQPTVFPLTAS